MTTSTMKKGGSYRLIYGYAADNDTVVVPAGFALTNVIIEKIGTTAGDFALGTTDNGTDVVNTVAMGTVNGAFTACTLLKTMFSRTASTSLIITSATSAATYNLYVLMQKID